MSTGPRTPRDPRLDFFRGVAMLIIFVAHVPLNLWTLYIPARFGWSDATEMFVFSSGFAAAIAFGGTFIKAGFWYGTARILYRVWQIYAAHIAMFIFIAALVFAGTQVLDTGKNYVIGLGINWFFDNPGRGLTGLFTLTYVPNYFDILPMYIGALVMVPVVMALARFSPYAAMAFSVAVYAGVWLLDWSMPAHPDFPDREWFFNPFGWQLLFFTGFAFSRGWLPAPPIKRGWVIAAAVFVLVTIPMAKWGIAKNYDILREIREIVWPIRAKTDFGLLRYIHFLALTYVALAIVNGREQILRSDWVKPIITVGQNSLAVFLLSMGLARIAGMVLDIVGRSGFTFALVNLSGMAILVAFAYWCTFLRTQPWRKIAAERDANTLKNSSTTANQASTPRDHRLLGGTAPAE